MFSLSQSPDPIESTFDTGIAPYAVERTLLVDGVLEACPTSKLHRHLRLETPAVPVEYRACAESRQCQLYAAEGQRISCVGRGMC